MATAGPPRCAICQSPILPAEKMASCPACRTAYHAECWAENLGCAVYGCSQVPATEARRELEIPAAYWGQEHKPCPSCGASILAAAVRCRACGAVFESARPQSVHEFSRQQDAASRRPGLKRTTVWLFVFSVLPCSAPVAALVGAVWYYSNRGELEGLPALYPTLSRLGLAISIGQTVLAVFAAVLYTLLRG
jgi:predicted RNA-binding Zn-ribbon protein involved in translation (DUF1610 family)